jgi:hypothetical protein
MRPACQRAVANVEVLHASWLNYLILAGWLLKTYHAAGGLTCRNWACQVRSWGFGEAGLDLDSHRREIGPFARTWTSPITWLAWKYEVQTGLQGTQWTQYGRILAHIPPHVLRTNATANGGRVGCWGWGAGHHRVCAGDRHGAYSVPVAPADGRFPRRGVFATGAPQGNPAPRQLAPLICIRTLLRPQVKLPFWFRFL